MAWRKNGLLVATFIIVNIIFFIIRANRNTVIQQHMWGLETYGVLALDSNYIYHIDSNTVIQKYDKETGKLLLQKSIKKSSKYYLTLDVIDSFLVTLDYNRVLVLNKYTLETMWTSRVWLEEYSVYKDNCAIKKYRDIWYLEPNREVRKVGILTDGIISYGRIPLVIIKPEEQKVFSEYNLEAIQVKMDTLLSQIEEEADTWIDFFYLEKHNLFYQKSADRFYSLKDIFFRREKFLDDIYSYNTYDYKYSFYGDTTKYSNEKLSRIVGGIPRAEYENTWVFGKPYSPYSGSADFMFINKRREIQYKFPICYHLPDKLKIDYKNNLFVLGNTDKAHNAALKRYLYLINTVDWSAEAIRLPDETTVKWLKMDDNNIYVKYCIGNRGCYFYVFPINYKNK